MDNDKTIKNHSNSKRIVVFGNKSKNRLNYYLWREAIEKNLITYIPNIYSESIVSRVYSLFIKLVFNHISFKIIPPLKYIKQKLEPLNKFFIPSIPEDTDILVISHLTVGVVPYSKWQQYKNRGIKIVLFLFDSMEVGFMKSYVDKIQNLIRLSIINVTYSFDKSDCKKYGFRYWEQCCTPLPQKTKEISTDLYFAGRDKGRMDLILSITKRAVLKHVIIMERIPKLTCEREKSNSLYNLLKENLKRETLPYESMLKEVQQSNVLLDIVQPGQSGVSWRLIEALYYNKKLITNNQSVKDNKYYNSNWILIINTAEDIDFDWVKKREQVNYHYQNDYSPINFINEVIRFFENT